mmetsp:Transcript_5303/g.17602  ORF Transcript_5303/g.17602 Transcript_5303/m.17602 type:complete len:172 (-) Transcript_5303:784-1299(-)
MAGGKSKKRRPLVEAPHRPMRSMRRAREVTSKFHEHTHAIAAAQARGDRAAAQEAQEALDALGGRDAYQQASILTTERSKHTSKWLFSILTKNGMRPGKGQPPLKVLEVGAVNTQILSVPWLDVRAIDINSQARRAHGSPCPSPLARVISRGSIGPSSSYCNLPTQTAPKD